jgi:sugar phosphate isomerase/epimerase
LPNNIAVQLYSVREGLERDAAAVIQKLAELGAAAIETWSVAETVPLLDPLLQRHGIRPLSAHVTVAELAEPDPLFASLRDHGYAYAVLGWIEPENRETAEQCEQVVETLNRASEIADSYGLRLGYHNHAFEFEPRAEGTMFDLLVGNTDPRVFFELDVHWIERAALDGVGMIRALTGRVPLLHVKDLAVGSGEYVRDYFSQHEPDTQKTFVPAGTGVIAWEPLIEAAQAAGTEWYIVEQDYSPDIDADLATGINNTRALLAAQDAQEVAAP